MTKKNSNGQGPPEDIQDAWFGVMRAAQAACSGNGGYGILRIEVAVNGSNPVLWGQPKLVEKLSPRRVADIEISEETMAALLAHMDVN